MRRAAPPSAALAALLLAACSEYGIANGDRNAGGGAPDAWVDPLVAEQTACGAATTEVQVGNQGDADLTVLGLEVVGSDWALVDAAALPLTVSPGAQVALHLQASPASGVRVEGTLRVLTDDAEEPEITVALAATGDAAPSVAIGSPAADEVLSAGALSLVGTVQDDLDPPEALAVAWSSTVDGAIASGFAQADGSAAAEWAAGRSDGPHTLRLTVTDTCGNEASAEVAVCQQAGYVEDELSLESWNFEGDARWDADNGWLELTAATENAVGTAFQTGSTVSGDSVDIEFLFWIGGGSGADGLSLTALDSSRATTFLGGTGCGLGYGGDAACTAGPALPGWSLEVDTYFNDGQDPTSQDHLSFTFDGDVDAPVVSVALPEMEDTGWHTLRVSVAAPRLRVEVDGTAYIDQDLSGFTAFPAWVGFTAGTGSLTNQHLVDSLEVTEYVCPQ
jgi:hypothetical protein